MRKFRATRMVYIRTPSPPTPPHTQISNETLEGESDLPVSRVNDPPTLCDINGIRIPRYIEITSPSTG